MGYLVRMDWLIGAFKFITASRLDGVMFAVMFLVVGRVMARRRDLSARYGKRLFLGYVVIALVQLVFVIVSYWVVWHQKSCGIACKLYFPPFSNYYFNQVIVRWMSTLAFNACVGLVSGVIFAWFSRKTKGMIIDQLDVDLLTVGGMVAGWPNVLILYGLLFIVTILVTIGKSIVLRSTSVRMIITPALPYIAALVALFGNDMAKWLKLYEIGLTLV